MGSVRLPQFRRMCQKKYLRREILSVPFTVGHLCAKGAFSLLPTPSPWLHQCIPVNDAILRQTLTILRVLLDMPFLIDALKATKIKSWLLSFQPSTSTISPLCIWQPAQIWRENKDDVRNHRAQQTSRFLKTQNFFPTKR